jgi:hypothetical protein
MRCLVGERHIIELHAVDVRSNKLRGYRLVLGADPDGDAPFIVVAQWGRLRGQLRTRSYECLSGEKALSCCRAILRTRKRHGYRVTHVHKQHPLAEWMESIHMPKERAADVQLRLFDPARWAGSLRPQPSAAEKRAFSSFPAADWGILPTPLTMDRPMDRQG